MRQAVHNLAVATKGQGLYEVTDDVRGWVEQQGF